MTYRNSATRALTLACAVSMVAGCSVGGFDTVSADEPRPTWCGPDSAIIGFADGSGGNSWKRTNIEELKDELAKCSSVTDFITTDAQGDTQKAIADIKSLGAQGVDGMLVFPDSGKAVLPALRYEYKSGVAVVPYRVSPGGSEGSEYTTFVAADFNEIGRIYGEWLVESLPNGEGNVLFLGGPPANSQDLAEYEGLQQVLVDHPGIKLIGDQPFTVTNWTPAETQQATSTMLSRFPQIDAVMTDFAATSILTAFQQAGRPLPLLASADVNGLSCQYEQLKDANPEFQLLTVTSQTYMVRLAVQHVVAEATGGVAPESKIDVPRAFEDSISGTPSAPVCDPTLPEDALLSSSLDPQRIGEVLQ
ncbi:substrate-binding domain-containing protein [Rhodococcus sp. BP-332]|uniref:substrate-binding domain-containing protein n=1 Tax=unclassified Rhodococcus (in: high G+C Gram-positive bacteria) TaxID=192944 RepID=UPI001C9ADB3C|nr:MULTISPECIES: substrate-binding domain-containing protein [unclassified Rhodococcus (in: high G+C Gram-positive bacteria)]MBY6678031.1 substrate-binding domain-containing protein [Rhodococcus sp. BP-332]